MELFNRSYLSFAFIPIKSFLFNSMCNSINEFLNAFPCALDFIPKFSKNYAFLCKDFVSQGDKFSQLLFGENVACQ